MTTTLPQRPECSRCPGCPGCMSDNDETRYHFSHSVDNGITWTEVLADLDAETVEEMIEMLLRKPKSSMKSYPISGIRIARIGRQAWQFRPLR